MNSYNVLITPDMPRCMRMHGDFIQGLIDLYESMGAGIRDGMVVEVGCWQGESTEVACQMVGRLVCVDPWYNPADEAVFNIRLGRFSNFVKCKMFSLEAADTWADCTIDAVYIDAMHNYSNVKADILAWSRKVKIGGWISGHDYDEIDTHTGVVQAVNELLGKPVNRFKDSSWSFQKTGEIQVGGMK